MAAHGNSTLSGMALNWCEGQGRAPLHDPVRRYNNCPTQRRRNHDYLDHSIHHSADRVDWRLHGVSRGQWIDSPAAGVRSDLVDPAFRVGNTRSVDMAAANRQPGTNQLRARASPEKER